MPRRHSIISRSFLLLVVLAGLFIGSQRSALAADAAPSTTDPLKFTPELGIPGLLPTGVPITVTGSTLGEYVRVIFVYFIWSITILGVVMVIYGGVKWVAAAGNPGRINDARSVVNSAIVGVVIALTSIVMLNIINPNLTSFRSLKIVDVNQELYDFVNNIAIDAGTITPCDKKVAAGAPDKACSGRNTTNNTSSGVTFGCEDLNLMINRTAQGDPISTKAIILNESQKITGPEYPYSGPEFNNGPGYGLGQFKFSFLQDNLKKVGRNPVACQKLDSDGIHLTQGCKDWLDDRTNAGIGTSGLDMQVKMIATAFGGFMNDSKCIKNNLALAAAAYNQGRGGASDAFCSTTYIQDPVKRDKVRTEALNYIAHFKLSYATACATAQ